LYGTYGPGTGYGMGNGFGGDFDRDIMEDAISLNEAMGPDFMMGAVSQRNYKATWAFYILTNLTNFNRRLQTVL
jgi:hypothetical protein